MEFNWPYQDLDNLDLDALHFMIKEESEIIAYCRIVLFDDRGFMGRVIVDEEYRDRKLGYRIVEEAIDYFEKNIKLDYIEIEGQVRLEKFYNKLGFVRQSEDYILDNLLHCKMLRKSKEAVD